MLSEEDFLYMNIKAKVVDQDGLNRILTRIAHEILEKNKGAKNLVLIGMRTRGEFLANRIFEKIKSIENIEIPLGVLDVTLYRDDFRTRLKQPEVSVSDITFDINEKIVILVDDVLYTGRTVRAAINALFDCARPCNIQLAVLIDRGHRELPIRPDYVGRNLRTSRSEHIEVEFDEHNVPQSVSVVK